MNSYAVLLNWKMVQCRIHASRLPEEPFKPSSLLYGALTSPASIDLHEVISSNNDQPWSQALVTIGEMFTSFTSSTRLVLSSFPQKLDFTVNKALAKIDRLATPVP